MGRTRLGRDERRRQIVDSAIETFAQRGYHGTRMDDVARAAGVNVALIYQHFPTKEDLFESAFEILYADHPMADRLDELTHGDDDLAVFRYFAECYATLGDRDVAIHRLLVSAAIERPDLYRRHFDEKEDYVVAVLARYIARRVSEGALRPVDAGLAARLFASQAYVYMLESRALGGSRWDDYAPDAVLSAMTAGFLDGLRLPPA